MVEGFSSEEKVFHARIDASGRIVVPADAQLRKKTQEGDSVVLTEDEHGGLHLRTLGDVVHEIQEHYRNLIPADVSLADELIAERRVEAERE